MKITADTNVLVRALTEDHIEQSKAAQNALSKADFVSFDKKAVSVIEAQGKSAKQLS
jgi:predicted nucleic-acid-binding protein